MSNSFKAALVATAIVSPLVIPASVNAQSTTAAKPRPHRCVVGAPAGAVCQTIAVPENHSKPTGKMIDLEVMVLPATGTAKKGLPMIVLPDVGGQGTVVASEYARLAIRKTNDIVMVDQRGTTPGKPNLSCQAADEADVLNFFTADPLEAELAKTNKEVKKCFDGYRAAGIDIDSYNSSESANDMPFVVKAIGAETANFYGAGVGGRVVLQTMRAHPKVVNSAILDSVEPASSPSWFTPSDRLAAATEGLEAFYKACASQPGCAASRGDLKAKVAAIREKLTKTPLSVPVTLPQGPATVKINGNDAVALLLQLTVDVATLPLAPTAVDVLSAGDTATLTQLLNQQFAPVPGAPANALPPQSSLFTGQLCADSGYREPTAADKAAMAPSSLVASTLGLLAAPQCLAANVKALPASFRAPVNSSIPTLLLTGALNPIAPPSLSRNVAKTLKNATLVSFPDQSRYVMLPSACAQKIVASFLSAPSKVDQSCAAKLTGPKFA
jgi:pimeloyl-ACP methyl ester carboxylesterase